MTSPFDRHESSGYPTDDSEVILWLVFSILSAFFCCQPVGIVAAIFGVLAYIDHKTGNHQQAAEKLKYTKLFTILAAGLIVVLTCVAMVFFLPAVFLV